MVKRTRGGCVLSKTQQIGNVAQRLELRTFNPLVVGSNPAVPSQRAKTLKDSLAGFHWFTSETSHQRAPRCNSGSPNMAR